MTEQAREVGATFADKDGGEARWGLGGLLLFKVSAENTGGRFAILEERMVRGCATPPHVHTEDHETFIVLEGELSIWVEGVVHRAGAGSVSYVKPGVLHAWRVESEEARTIVISTPQHEAFYRDATKPAPGPFQPPDAPALDMEFTNNAAERHGVQLLGPPWTGEVPVMEREPNFGPDA